jgi:hypothetical protein
MVGDGGVPVTDSSSDAPKPDAAACNATTCPSGCCDPTGTCQTGSAITQCGTLGESCQNCTAEGFSLCDPTRRACGNLVPDCDPATCSGCCEGNVCFAGSDPNECGVNGAACAHCETSGLACSNQQCVKPACGPGTCSGCCFGQDCISGSDSTACGTGGQVCTNCAANGGTCDNGVCQGQTGCNPNNCPGCCIATVCLSGTDPDACGTGGQECTNCESNGGICIPEGGMGGSSSSGGGGSSSGGGGGSGSSGGGGPGGPTGPGGFCQIEMQCGPDTCPGCCAGNNGGGPGACLPGNDSMACGSGGEQCSDCAAFGEICGGGGAGFGQCSPPPPPPMCNPKTCASGCCDASNNCLPGNLNSFCGSGGVTCVNCGASGESCKGQVCVVGPPSCNAANCAGCCDTMQNCQAGFIDTQCGGAGLSCEDCTQLAPPSTCDVNVSPPTCQSQQAQCPAPYPSCPANIETPSPAQQSVCSQSELQNAGEACEGGAHSAACNSFFTIEQSQNPACATCLSAFDFDFSQLTGLTTCVAPFVDASCNHITGCLVDCTDQSCAQCVDQGALELCQNEVPTTVCASYYNDAQCIESAFVGQGSFCDPNQGSGFFGDWLVQVGQFYCAQ